MYQKKKKPYKKPWSSPSTIKKSLTGEDIDMLYESRQRGLGSQSMSYKDDIDGA